MITKFGVPIFKFVLVLPVWLYLIVVKVLIGDREDPSRCSPAINQACDALYYWVFNSKL